jgi:hypothetical protein
MAMERISVEITLFLVFLNTYTIIRCKGTALRDWIIIRMGTRGEKIVFFIIVYTSRIATLVLLMCFRPRTVKPLHLFDVGMEFELLVED